uniref:DHC_N2 domain-containing protein n=1 Tax=Meloidogyne hapla TaxID=6305 RepID=A0A1I8BIC0_MELHA
MKSSKNANKLPENNSQLSARVVRAFEDIFGCLRELKQYNPSTIKFQHDDLVCLSKHYDDIFRAISDFSAENAGLSQLLEAIRKVKWPVVSSLHFLVGESDWESVVAKKCEIVKGLFDTLQDFSLVGTDEYFKILSGWLGVQLSNLNIMVHNCKQIAKDVGVKCVWFCDETGTSQSEPPKK